ncbi:MAG TPA: hypothetical protein VGB83_03735 [Actinomycetota bacterium]
MSALATFIVFQAWRRQDAIQLWTLAGLAFIGLRVWDRRLRAGEEKPARITELENTLRTLLFPVRLLVKLTGILIGIAMAGAAWIAFLGGAAWIVEQGQHQDSGLLKALGWTLFGIGVLPVIGLVLAGWISDWETGDGGYSSRRPEPEPELSWWPKREDGSEDATRPPRRSGRPDHVSKSQTSAYPLGFGPMLYKTEIEEDGATYTGHGWTRKEANQEASGKYGRGQRDRR